MRCHQRLTGSANGGDNAFHSGHVGNKAFTVYAAGLNVVILDGNFDRVQILSVSLRSDLCSVAEGLSCIEVSPDHAGVIAVAAADARITLFTPVARASSHIEANSFGHWWVETACLKSPSPLSALSFLGSNHALLTASDELRLWKHCHIKDESKKNVVFDLGQDNEDNNEEDDDDFGNVDRVWECVWRRRLPSRVTLMAATSDGRFFATAGQHDRLVRVWFNEGGEEGYESDNEQASINFSFVYLAHPATVTSFSWRKTSVYMAKLSVPSVLVTSCVDSICRLWSETQLPPDDTVHVERGDKAEKAEDAAKTRKRRMWQRMRHMRQSFDARRHASQGPESSCVPQLTSETFSAHELHLGPTALPVNPSNVHFHLAATVNAATDIPLVPSLKSGFEANFVLHWMNNKEVQFTADAEHLLTRVFAEIIADQDNETENNDNNEEKEEKQENSNETDNKKSNKKPPPRPPPVRAFHTRPPPVLLSTAVPKHEVPDNAEATKSKESSKDPRWNEVVERRYEQLLQDWHQRADLLFAVHPVDGSFLVWVADFIDPYQPGAFRQTQVSFSSRIPSALPLGDAMTLNNRIELFNASSGIDFMHLLEQLTPRNSEGEDLTDNLNKSEKEEENELKEENEEEKEEKETVKKTAKKKLSVPKEVVKSISSDSKLKKYSSPPELCLITKHSNGTLNLWTLLFEERTHYCTLLNISHVARASGHRFAIRAITPHPVLPLVITTSHNCDKNNDDENCIGSELILWRIEPVGPLPKAQGGVTELARINDHKANAFNEVAWLPTLLPCMTSSGADGHRGSPSAAFVADDGDTGLRVYQAVIDARHLLTGAHRFKEKVAGNENDEYPKKRKGSKYNVVSSQSNARPGAILQLDHVCKYEKKWGLVLMLHVFQEQLIRLPESRNMSEDEADFGLIPTQMEAMVDLEQRVDQGHFLETFFVVMAEKGDDDQVNMHVWKTSLKGTDDNEDNEDEKYEEEDEEEEEPSSSTSSSPTRRRRLTSELTSRVSVSSEKVCTQSLSDNQEKLLFLTPAVGHLSSSSMYPACLAPYLMVSASSNRRVRFWRLQQMRFEEWPMADSVSSSHIDVEGDIVDVKAAYSGRIAVAHRHNTNDNIVAVSIFECESTGGSEWILEDTVHLRAAVQRLIITDDDADLRQSLLKKQQRLAHLDDYSRQVAKSSMMIRAKEMERVPSYSAMEALRRDTLMRRQQLISSGSNETVLNDHNIMLDWVSKEDGSHLLTVCVNNKIVVLTAVSTDISEQQARAHEARYSLLKNDFDNDNDEDKNGVTDQIAKQKRLRKSSSMAIKPINEAIRWMKIRKLVLHSTDGLTTPSPLAMAWVRDGVLMCALKAEMAVFSQWRSDDHFVPKTNTDNKENLSNKEASKEAWRRNSQYRSLKEEDIYHLAQESQMRGMRSHGSFSNLAMAATIKHTSHQQPKRISHEGEEDVDAFGFFDLGLFEAAHIASPVLPQYHPKQLMELIHSGKIRWVKAILAHLVRCVHSSHTHASQGREQQKWTRSRALSISAANASSSLVSATLDQLSPSAEHKRSSTGGVNDDFGNLDYNEIHSIPPLPLWTLLAADIEIVATNVKGAKAKTVKKSFDEERHALSYILKEPYDALFSSGMDVDEEEEDVFGLDADDATSSQRRARTISSSSTGDKNRGLSYFGPREASFLSGLLTHAHLPGLTSLDQMHLLALADTVSSVALDPTDRLALAKTATATMSSNKTGQVDSLDACGLRFLFALQHFSYLKRCLPLSQRASLQRNGLMPSHLVWAFHSDNANDLLDAIPSVKRGQPLWSELREVGVAWWLRHYSDLKTLIEKVAKAAFQRSQDPLDAALFYLALGKQSLLCALYRSIKDERMRDFFSNNFNEERWRKAALKNAFALLGKQRFHHAAAFFVLASRLDDALQICLDKLEDLQLAMVVARLHDGERESQPVSLKRLVYQHVLGRDAANLESSTMDLEKAHPDPFLRSMALWMNGEYTASLSTLVELNVGQLHSVYGSYSVGRTSQVKDPSIFNFYIYLRNHPLILKQQQLAQGTADRMGVKASNVAGLSPLERRIYFSTAHFHLQSGCPALAVEVLSKLPEDEEEEEDNNVDSSNKDDKGAKGHEDLIRTGTIDEMDWGQPVMQVEEEELKLDWGSDHDEDEDEDKEEEDKESKKKNEESNKELGNGVEEKPKEENKRRKSSVSSIDVMAQQLKFIACLRIMMEELATLATGFEVDGGMLRCQLYLWLEREVEALRHLCNYGHGQVNIDSSNEDEDHFEDVQQKFSGRAPTLHEVMRAEKEDFEAKLHRAAKRKHWLKANQTLLRTLLSYCSLHGGHGSGLASVRMELVLLLQELQQERSHNKQLLSPLPLPTMLPLLSACIAQQKTVVVDPVRHLQALSHDMITAMAEDELPIKATNQSGLLRDLSVALSSCIYQSLCDSENTSISLMRNNNDNDYSKKRGNIGPGSAMLQALSLLSSNYQRSSFLSNRKAGINVSKEVSAVTTEPSKWPGVTSLRAWLDREKDDDLLPNLTLFLCETFAAVFLGLMHFALASRDPQILYRLASLHDRINEKFWADIFGGGSRRVLQVETNRKLSGERQQTMSADEGNDVSGTSPSSGGQLLTRMSSSITKQRVKLNIKLLGMQIGSSTETVNNAQNTNNERVTYQENFVPPETSMISKLIAKPQLEAKDRKIDYDSGEESDENEDDDSHELLEDEEDDLDPFKAPDKVGDDEEEERRNSEFAWAIMRTACIKLAQITLENFVAVAGVDLPELPVNSPLLFSALRITESWLESSQASLASMVPSSSLRNAFTKADVDNNLPAIEKYSSLFDINKSPFPSRGRGLRGVRRLWHFLVRQTPVQRLFVQHIFGQMGSVDKNKLDVDEEDGSNDLDEDFRKMLTPVKVIHRDNEAITAFCINRRRTDKPNVSSGLMTVATSKELLELNISQLLNPSTWHDGLHDETHFDVLNLNEDPESNPQSNLLVVQSPNDTALLPELRVSQASIERARTASIVSDNSSSKLNTPTGAPAPFGPAQATPTPTKGASLVKGVHFAGCQKPQFVRLVLSRSRHLLRPVKRHRMEGVRKLASHTHLPLYVTGCDDGCVRMWEWSHSQPVLTVRPAGVFARVNKLAFSQQGNKFGAADQDGHVALWQAANAAKPFFSYACQRHTHDFVFSGECSSLVCVAGESGDNLSNVAVLDTLMPQRRSLVVALAFHEGGASSLLFVPDKGPRLISAGRRDAQVAIWDLRQTKQQVHVLKAHQESGVSIRSLALEPCRSSFFVTGSSSGDIRVWDSSNYSCLATMSDEHTRQHGLFKNVSQGVSQLFVDEELRLFSCGADGAMKLRQMPSIERLINNN